MRRSPVKGELDPVVDELKLADALTTPQEGLGKAVPAEGGGDVGTASLKGTT